MLAEALASVRAQTFTDYEIIVVSNGESGETQARSHAAAARHGARYFSLPIGNLSIARNFGIGEAKGAWIAFLDDDDIWLPAKLERQIAAANQTDASMIPATSFSSFRMETNAPVDRVFRTAGLTPEP